MVGSPYFIYASDAGKSEGEDVHVLLAGSDTDKFISSLPSNGIFLNSKPDASAIFDSTDLWAQWMNNFDANGQLSLAWDDQVSKNIQSFQYQFPFSSAKVTFSSTAECINNAFGPLTTIGGPLQTKIPVPGIGTNGDILYYGLDTAGMSTLSSTVADLFTYANVADLIDLLPAALSGASVSLDPTKAFKQRDALWVRPSFGFQTTVRFSFQLDNYQLLQDLLTKALPGLALPTVSVVCKKVLTAGTTASGTATFTTGSVVFYANGNIHPPSGSNVELSASVELSGNEISLTFLITGNDALDGILSWLGNLISSDLGKSVQDLLGKDGVFGSANLRRVRLSLEAHDPANPALSSFGFDVEVPANFGQDDTNKQQVTFLLSYFYSKDTGPLGMLSGQFWPGKFESISLSPSFFLIKNSGRRA